MIINISETIFKDMSLQQKLYTDAGMKMIFNTDCSLVTFTIIVSVGSEFTLLTSVDDQHGTDLVEDIFYKNYIYSIQDYFKNIGKFGINVIQPGANGITFQYKIYNK
jgi:hypothetical protein